MKEQQKPKYNMWQGTGFMVKNAWKNCKSVLFLCIALAVTTAAKSATELFLAPTILKKVETTAPLSELLFTIAVFSCGLLFLSGLKQYIDTNTQFGRISVRTSIVVQISNKIAKTSYPNLMDARFNDMESKASNACSSNVEATEYIWTIWTSILTNILGFSIYLALLSHLNPLLVCIAVLTTLLGYLVNKRISRWGYEHREEEGEYAKQLDYLHDVATKRSYAKDIRIFGLDTWINDVWTSILRLYQGFLRKRESVYIWADIADLLLTFLRNGAAYAYLLWLTLTQGLSASEFLLYFTAVSGFTQWIGGILEMFAQLHKCSLDLSTVREFLEYPEPFLFEEGKPVSKDDFSTYEFHLENVSFRYPEAKQDTIHHLNLTVHAGEKIAIVGLNGAGKTTLVKLICGFLDPTEGQILLNGKDIRQYNRQNYYTLFSAVFQDFSVLEASVAENIAQQTTHIDERQVWNCLKQAGLFQKIASLPKNVNTIIGRQVYEDGIELSGGQMQRLMLARALYKNAPVLILDEPTAALDPVAEAEIYSKFNDIVTDKTTVYISHRLSSCKFCDEIAVFHEGNVVQKGTHEELISDKTGKYYELWNAQAQYYNE